MAENVAAADTLLNGRGATMSSTSLSLQLPKRGCLNTGLETSCSLHTALL